MDPAEAESFKDVIDPGEAKSYKEVLHAFWAFDRNGDGMMSLAELSTLFRHLSPDVTDNVIMGLANEIDIDEDQQVSYEELVRWLWNRREDFQSGMTLDTMWKAEAEATAAAKIKAASFIGSYNMKYVDTGRDMMPFWEELVLKADGTCRWRKGESGKEHETNLGVWSVSGRPDAPVAAVIWQDGRREKFPHHELEGKAKIDSKEASVAPTPAGPKVLLGPVVGAITATTANLLLEIDSDAEIACQATPMLPREVTGRLTCDYCKGRVQLSCGQILARRKSCIAPTVVKVELQKEVPGVFQLHGLMPDTEYDIRFDPLSEPSSTKLEKRGCTVRTLPQSINRLRLLALSCDIPCMMYSSEENPWGRVAMLCKEGRCDMLLHLGDQIYTLERGSDQRAIAELQGINEDEIAPKMREAMRKRAKGFLQYRYRKTWGQLEKAAALANTANLMIWSDNDIGNNFSVVRKKDGSQKFPAEFLSLAMDCYHMYQRSLWDPGCCDKKIEEHTAVEEWYYKQYGPFGIFMVDMRGNRIQPDGLLHSGLPPILCERQKESIRSAFASDGLRCMVICAEIPFVGADPKNVKEQAEKFVLLKNHWVHEFEDLIWMLDLFFEWKAAVPGRELVMLTGDLHIGVDTIITDSKTGHTLRHITTSPITNEVSPFHTEEEGILNERYSFVSKPIKQRRNFCMVDLEYKDGVARCDIEMVCIPIYVPPPVVKGFGGLSGFGFGGFTVASTDELKATANGLCAIGCGRKASEGFPSCCRTCIETGGVEHGPVCNETYKKKSKTTEAMLCAIGCGRKAAEGFATCCRTCQLSGGSEHGPVCNKAHEKHETPGDMGAASAPCTSSVSGAPRAPDASVAVPCFSPGEVGEC